MNDEYCDAIREIVSETQKTPGHTFAKVMAIFGLNFGTADQIDDNYRKFYEQDFKEQIRQKDATIARLEDCLRDYEGTGF